MYRWCRGAFSKPQSPAFQLKIGHNVHSMFDLGSLSYLDKLKKDGCFLWKKNRSNWTTFLDELWDKVCDTPFVFMRILFLMKYIIHIKVFKE